ncbi:methyltransferase domain-containing protein [Rhodobacterales bacterium HKCCA1058]|nr:methyltransferase domain-containing protein [Rhodobacterales bacterium HKCCA1058]
MSNAKNIMEKEFYKSVPKARKINPFFRESFNLFYDAHLSLVAFGDDAKVLNIYSSADLSSQREHFFRDTFFSVAEYHGVDFWKDQFIPEGHDALDQPGDERHLLPYGDNTFDVVVTTKVIMEHVTSPDAVVSELYRVLKPGGRAFVIAPHVRRQHQAPYDFFRYTEYGLKHIFASSGFSECTTTPTGGFMALVGYYGYFFQRGLNIPKFFEKTLDLLHYWLVEPICYGLDRLDNGYGRDMTLYFMVRAEK